MRKVVLCILDGWGHSSKKKYNAIKHAKTLHYDQIISKYPKSFLRTSGEDVGLPEGQMGNSEVGHMNIGAGRIVQSDLPRINRYISKQGLNGNRALKNFLDISKMNNGVVHIIGLISPGGVHSHQTHILHVIKYVSKFVKEVNLHAITDGRDVGPKTALGVITEFEKNLPFNGRFFVKINNIIFKNLIIRN